MRKAYYLYNIAYVSFLFLAGVNIVLFADDLSEGLLLTAVLVSGALLGILAHELRNREFSRLVRYVAALHGEGPHPGEAVVGRSRELRRVIRRLAEDYAQVDARVGPPDRRGLHGKGHETGRVSPELVFMARVNGLHDLTVASSSGQCRRHLFAFARKDDPWKDVLRAPMELSDPEQRAKRTVFRLPPAHNSPE